MLCVAILRSVQLHMRHWGCLLVACKGQLGPFLHVSDLDKLLSWWRCCRPHSWHTHLLIPLHGPANAPIPLLQFHDKAEGIA